MNADSLRILIVDDNTDNAAHAQGPAPEAWP